MVGRIVFRYCLVVAVILRRPIRRGGPDHVHRQRRHRFQYHHARAVVQPQRNGHF